MTVIDILISIITFLVICCCSLYMQIRELDRRIRKLERRD